MAQILENRYAAGQTGSTEATWQGDPMSTVHGGSLCDTFVFKLDTDGDWVWGQYRGGTGNDYAKAIALDSSATSLPCARG
jgi:hypothetical protein